MRDTRLKFHPITGRPIVPAGWRRDGRAVWPVLGASEPPNQPPTPPTPPAPPGANPPGANPPGANPPGPNPPAPPGPPAGDKGFPDNTPVAEMTAEQQTAYWKFQARKHEGRVRQMGDYEDLKAKADQFDQLSAASRTEHEKALADARTEAADKARTEERQKLGGQIVQARMAAAIGDRLPAAQRDALVEGADTGRFIDAKTGDVDAQAIAEWVDRVAPKPSGAPPPGATPPPDLGQGRRTQPPAQGGVAAGRDLYANRHPKQTNNTT